MPTHWGLTGHAAVERAEYDFGEKPAEVWPDGPVEEIEEYEYEVDVPVDE